MQLIGSETAELLSVIDQLHDAHERINEIITAKQDNRVAVPEELLAANRSITRANVNLAYVIKNF